MKPRSALALLGSMPRRFRFDAAVRVLTRARRTADPAEAMRFRSPPGLVYPPADVLEVRQPGEALPEVTVGLMGLTGPSGVLPRYYTETSHRRCAPAQQRCATSSIFSAHRFVAFFARGGAKYRPARAAEIAQLQGATGDPVARVLLALTGYGTPHLAPSACRGTEPLLHYAGLFALRPRSAERLGALISDWLGMKVEVVEFAGAWLSLPPDQRTRLSAQRRLVPARRRCRGRRARLGSAGAHRPAHRPARPAGLPATAAGSHRAAPPGVAGARLCRLRARLRHQSGAGGATGAAAAPGRGRRSAAAAGLEHLDSRRRRAVSPRMMTPRTRCSRQR